MPFTDKPADDATELTGVRGIILTSQLGLKFRLEVTHDGRLVTQALEGWHQVHPDGPES